MRHKSTHLAPGIWKVPGVGCDSRRITLGYGPGTGRVPNKGRRARNIGLVVGRVIVGDGVGGQVGDEALDIIERLADRIRIDRDVAFAIHEMRPERSERGAPGLVRIRAVGSAAKRKQVARLVTLL